MSSNNNIGQVFDRVISIEAWHSAFCTENCSASIHVDLSFLQAKMGQDSTSPVRFEVSSRRAKLAFVIPENEPLAVIQRSVARESPMKGSITTSSTTSVDTGVSAAGRLSLSASPSGGVETSANFDISDKSVATVNVSGEVSQFAVRQYNSDGRHSWEISPITGQKLAGKVWNPVQEPRLSVKHTAPKSKIDPVCRVQVSCKKDDIVIDKIEIKKGVSLKDRFKSNREAAASAFLRKILSQHGLEYGDFDEKFSDVMMADVAVQKEVT